MCCLSAHSSIRAKCSRRQSREQKLSKREDSMYSSKNFQEGMSPNLWATLRRVVEFKCGEDEKAHRKDTSAGVRQSLLFEGSSFWSPTGVTPWEVMAHHLLLNFTITFALDLGLHPMLLWQTTWSGRHPVELTRIFSISGPPYQT